MHISYIQMSIHCHINLPRVEWDQRKGLHRDTKIDILYTLIMMIVTHCIVHECTASLYMHTLHIMYVCVFAEQTRNIGTC